MSYSLHNLCDGIQSFLLLASIISNQGFGESIRPQCFIIYPFCVFANFNLHPNELDGIALVVLDRSDCEKIPEGSSVLFVV